MLVAFLFNPVHLRNLILLPTYHLLNIQAWPHRTMHGYLSCLNAHVNLMFTVPRDTSVHILAFLIVQVFTTPETYFC